MGNRKAAKEKMHPQLVTFRVSNKNVLLLDELDKMIAESGYFKNKYIEKVLINHINEGKGLKK